MKNKTIQILAFLINLGILILLFISWIPLFINLHFNWPSSAVLIEHGFNEDIQILITNLNNQTKNYVLSHFSFNLFIIIIAMFIILFINTLSKYNGYHLNALIHYSLKIMIIMTSYMLCFYLMLYFSWRTPPKAYLPMYKFYSREAIEFYILIIIFIDSYILSISIIPYLLVYTPQQKLQTQYRTDFFNVKYVNHLL